MFPLSHMMKSFVRVGTLKMIDARGNVHVFAGEPGPNVTIGDPTRGICSTMLAQAFQCAPDTLTVFLRLERNGLAA